MSKCADLGNHLIAEIPLVCPCHVCICALGRKHLSGGAFDFRLTPTSWGICKNERP